MSLFSRIAGSLMGDAAPEAARPSINLDMLSSFLPYRMFDAATQIFHNRASIGFILEAPPLVGADERVADILTQFLSEGIPAGACVQIMHFCSPRTNQIIGEWFGVRYHQRGVYEQIARYRADLLAKGAWESLSKDAPFHVRHHRLIISMSMTQGSSVEEMIGTREGLISVLRSLDVPVRVMEPDELIRLVDDLTSPTTAVEDDDLSYNPYDPIADQAIRRDIELVVEEHRLLLRTERFRPVGHRLDGTQRIGEVYPDRFDIRHFSVKNFPIRWAPWESARLIGDLFTDKLRMPCPTATVLCLMFPDQEAASSKAGMKFMRTTSLADSKSARFLPHLREASEEWRHVREQLTEGRKLVRAFYGVTTFSPEGHGDRHEGMVKSIYKSAGWDLIDERFLQIQGLLTAMPMTLGDGLGTDMERLKRFRTMLSSTAANIMPVQGEYLGGKIPHLLFIGRRGQPLFWSPFENGAGNHNCAIMGKSGSGKSVLLQELCCALRGAGAKVVVIDDGRSFMNSVKLQGGAFIEFTMSSGFGLNPFAMIDGKRAADDQDYRLDCMSMLKAIISQMARYIDRLDDTERGLIDQAVNRVWEAKGTGGSIDDVAQALRDTQVPEAINLAIAMGSYTAGGTYAGFFSGASTLKLESDFTVFELSDLASREELRAVVLTAIMFMTTQMMTRTPRSVKKMLLVDEAWQMLRGGSMADFVEAYARTCRKYGGSLVTATQSLNDYYKSSGAEAALENSDWMLVLQQKPETISDFRKSQRLDMDDRTETMIRSLKRNANEYSEVFIKGPDVQSVGRLVLDPYSATIFSSSPQTFADIERLQAAGLSIEEAIRHVAFGKDDPNAGLPIAAE